MYSYNRRQRREIEKNLGLHKEYQKMTDTEKAEVRKKKRQVGEQIHLQNVQEIENRRLQEEANNYAKQVQSWIDGGKTPEQAEEIVKSNYAMKEKRERELAERKAKKQK